MRRKKGKLLLGLLVAVAFMGIGYATIAGVSMLINGSATVKSRGEMKVRFVRNDAEETAIDNPTENAIIKTGKHLDGTDIPSNTLEAEITSDTTASFSANEMTTVGDYAEFAYTVVNESEGVDVMLSFDVDDENDMSRYFEISKSTDKTLLSDGETTKIRVKVKLVESPKVEDVTGTFKVTITADPVEQEETTPEVSAGTTEATSASTFAKALQNSEVNTINLENDITISQNANLEVREDTTINFNGNTLTIKPGSLKVKEGAELVLSDENGTGGITAAKNAVTVEDGGELTVESGTYETTEYSGRGAVFTIPSGVDNAKITINGGTIAGKYFAISSWGNSDVEIKGGDISSTSSSVLDKSNGTSYYAYAVKVTGGHLDMTGGTVTGVHGGIAIEGSATATIDGGTVIINNRGSNDSYYCFYLAENGSVEVLNGTFTNNGTRSLIYTSSTELINLKGGDWTAKSTYPFNNASNGGKDYIKIYDGTYKKNTNGTLTDYNVSAYRVN